MIQICTSAPCIRTPTGIDPVTGPAGVLLRILLLSPEPRVPIDAAVAVMGVMKSGIGTYVGTLRDALGGDAFVRRNHGTLEFTGDRMNTDAGAIDVLFKEATYLADSVRDARGDDMRAEFIPVHVAKEMLPKLEEIVSMYNGSPAMGLGGYKMENLNESQQHWAIQLDDVVSAWVDLWMTVQLMRADCLLTIGPPHIVAKQVVKDLLAMARTPDPPAEVWPRLLKAAQLAEDPRISKKIWALVENFYAQEGEPIPDKLRTLAPSSTSIPPDKVAHPHRIPLERPLEDASQADPRIELADLLGITTASSLALRGSRLEPAECIARTKRRLYFSGVLASKWVLDPAIRFEFEELLERLDDDESGPGDVRFLVIDPTSDAYERLHQMRGGRLSDESVPHLRRLAGRFESFKVRVVNNLPAFRIIVIDDDIVSFSPYALQKERYATSRLGWAAPHVMLDPLAPFPLAEAFRLYFEEAWSDAYDL